MDSRFSTLHGQDLAQCAVSPGVPLTLEDAYDHCLALARTRPEHLLAASRLLPKGWRRPVAVIHAFARQGRDIADGGQMTPAERLSELAAMEAKLDLIRVGALVNDPVFLGLRDVIERHRLPLQPFYDLLHGFRMDARKRRYAHFGELMEYCRYSAFPIGRLLLFLFGVSHPRNRGHADALTAALRLISIVRDFAGDYAERGRIYLPREDMERLGVSPDHLRERRGDGALRQLLALQLNRAEHLLDSAFPLTRSLRGRLGLEVRMVFWGARRMIERLRDRRDPFDTPRLSRRDVGWMLWKALLRR